MTLQLSGAISFADIQTIFGGTNPIGLNEYYTNDASGFTTGVSGLPSTGSAISLQQFYGKSKGVNGLYNFTSHTFTNADSYGANGPILSQCRTSYSSASWTQDTTNNYLNMTTRGIQQWKVPATGTYTIEMAGAAGGFICTNSTARPGYGYKISANISLTQGSVLNIVVGQRGVGWPSGNTLVASNDQGAGGGGASCVFEGSTLYMIAAGGNGQSWDNHTVPDPDGQSTGATNTLTSQGRGYKGATFNANGDDGDALSILNGAVGGNRNLGYASTGVYSTGGGVMFAGGFGGGGGTNPYEGGGGGGYQAGIPKATNVYATTYPSQGATSYIAGTLTAASNLGTNTSGTLSDYTSLQGYVKITANFTITESPTLYTFTTHTFTNAGATGRTGPIISQVRSAYSAAAWAQDTTNNYLNMTTQGIQLWTVPVTGNYTITCKGARGRESNTYTTSYGLGASMTGTFSLTNGEVIKIIVGQIGTVGNSGAGGGGTGVIRNNNSILVIAGGGGGAGITTGSAGHGLTTETGGAGYTSTGAVSGNGGAKGYTSGDCGYSGGGGGFSTDGYGYDSGNDGGNPGVRGGGGGGLSFLNGGIGSTEGGCGSKNIGGFGCGGGGGGAYGGGGGGGYSGGSGSQYTGLGATGPYGSFGGGGGSLNNGSNQTNTAGANDGDGSVIITKV